MIDLQKFVCYYKTHRVIRMKENNFKDLNELIEFDKKNRLLSNMEFNLNKYSALVSSAFIPFSIYLLVNQHDFIYLILSTAALLSSTSSLISLKKFKSLNYDDYRSNTPIYIELEKTYNKLLEDLLNEIELSTIDDDPLSIILLVANCLIPSGFLSVTKRFHPLTSNDIYKIDHNFLSDCDIRLFGTYIASGYGCCRHINSFISDLLSKKGLKSDKVACIFNSLNNYGNLKENVDYIPNHLITGFIFDEQYYLVDAFNLRYNIKKEENYFTSQDNAYYILNFTNTAYQKEINWNLNIEYKNFSDEEINEKTKKIKTAIANGEGSRFLDFYYKHVEEINKIHKLSLLEIERTSETEHQKTKKYGK